MNSQYSDKKTISWSSRGRSCSRTHYLTGDPSLTVCGREVPSEFRQGVILYRDTAPVTCLRCIDIEYIKVSQYRARGRVEV